MKAETNGVPLSLLRGTPKQSINKLKVEMRKIAKTRMKSKNPKEKEKRKEKIEIWILTITLIIMLIIIFYGWITGETIPPGYDWFPSGFRK